VCRRVVFGRLDGMRGHRSNREEVRAVVDGPHAMPDTRLERQKLPGVERYVSHTRVKEHASLDHVHGDRALRSMLRNGRTRMHRYQHEAQLPCLQQRHRGAIPCLPCALALHLG
jgi:hypothetical protein